jgi:peptide/nickel transport system substrate-binding protein
MISSRRTHFGHRRRLLVIPVLAAMIATSCGGGDDDDDADEPEQTAEVTEEQPEATEAPTEEEETESVEAEVTTAPDDDTSDGGPVVETLPPETVPEPVQGGTLRYGLEADVDGLNPTTSALSSPGLMMSNAVFDTLTAMTADNEIVPFLAQSVEPASEDFKTWTLTLRPDVTFHDGTPLNADAIIVNFEAQRGDPLVGLAVRPFFPEQNAIQKIDDVTVQFNLLDSNAYFPAILSTQLGMVASPTWLAAAEADATLNQQPVGTGPFRFDTRSQDSVTRFVRNDEWWNGEVYLDAVEFYPVPDTATRVDLMLGGELEALQTTDPEAILTLQDEGIPNVYDDSAAEQFAMLNTAAPPFDDLRARQALAWATPRQTYLDLIGLGVIRGANERFIPEDPYANPNVVQASDDPDQAIALATEYCNERGGETNPVTGQPTCSDGKINIELQYSGPAVIQTRRAEILDEGWSAAFNVTFDELLEDEHIQQTALGQYNVNLWRQFEAEDPSADNVWLLCRTIGGISLNWPRYCDEQRDALLMQAQATTDQAERVSLYQQAEQMINDAYTYIFFTHTAWMNAFTDNVHGVCDRISPEDVPLKCAVAGRTWFQTVWID